MKIVLNDCYGGFTLSDDACDYLGISDIDAFLKYSAGKNRTDKDLIECIEVLGKSASGENSRLIIKEIPDFIEPYIVDYDGAEDVFAQITKGPRKCPSCTSINFPSSKHCTQCGYPLAIKEDSWGIEESAQDENHKK